MPARVAPRFPKPVIDAIKYNKATSPAFQTGTLSCITFARGIRSMAHRISSELYAKAVETFGKQGTLELATIIGDYAMAAIMLNATDQHLPAGRPQTLPHEIDRPCFFIRPADE